MVTLCDTAPALARRCNTLVQGIIPLCLSFTLMVDVTETAWLKGKYTEETLEGFYLGK
jgi:hypothetical protein